MELLALFFNAVAINVSGIVTCPFDICFLDGSFIKSNFPGIYEKCIKFVKNIKSSKISICPIHDIERTWF